MRLTGPLEPEGLTTAHFLERLRKLDVRLWVEGDQLRCNAPRGYLTDELRTELKIRKRQIMGMLQAEHSTIVPIQPAGFRLPLFGVPGDNADVYCWVRLARCLGQDQPFFGLEPPASGDQPAMLFARAILRHHPGGPYLLAGYCGGGALAFETALELIKQGAQIGLLALFESHCPPALTGQIPGRIDLFFASEIRETNWSVHASGGVEMFQGPEGCNFSNMLLEPHVGCFAARLRRRLAGLRV